MREHPADQPDYLEYRATIMLCLAAVVLSVRRFQGTDLDSLMLSYDTWPQEPWRLFTSCLLHGGWIHLLFNVIWIFRLGAILEPVLGLVPTIGVYLLLGMTSSGAQWALSGGGVGLSGIVYGIFGILWVLDRYHPNFRGVVSQETTVLFVVWFFLCIVATEIGAMNIANTAHGVGGVVGVLIGLTLTPLGMKRAMAWGLLGILTVVIALGATIGRPYVNSSENRVFELQSAALTAFEDNDPQLAAELLEEAIDLDPESAHSWHNLGVAYHRLGRLREADSALDRSEELESLSTSEADPADEDNPLRSPFLDF